MYEIDKKYGVPKEEISCPGCGLRYGHHNTKVDINSHECSKCVKEFKRDNVKLISAKEYIENYLGIHPFY